MFTRLALSLSFVVPGICLAQPLTLFSGLAPPVSYISTEDDQAKGMAVDMVNEVVACSGDQASITAHPWSRAVKLLESTPNSGLFVADRTLEREARFHWVGPIYRSMFSFYALKSAELAISDFAQLKSAGTIAVPRGWQAVKRARADGLTDLLEVSDTSQLWPMLKQERVKIIGVDELMLLSMAYETDQVERLVPYTEINGYLALKHDIPRAQATRWQQCFETLKKNGTYQRIYLHWVGQSAPN